MTDLERKVRAWYDAPEREDGIGFEDLLALCAEVDREAGEAGRAMEDALAEQLRAASELADTLVRERDEARAEIARLAALLEVR